MKGHSVLLRGHAVFYREAPGQGQEVGEKAGKDCNATFAIRNGQGEVSRLSRFRICYFE